MYAYYRGLDVIVSQDPPENHEVFFIEVSKIPLPPNGGGPYKLSLVQENLIWVISEVPENITPPLSPLEELHRQNQLLKAQIHAMETQYSFLENCIVEMAAMVY